MPPTVTQLELTGKARNTGGGCAPSPAPHELVRKGLEVERSRYAESLSGGCEHEVVVGIMADL
jgi:hypothetical protein